MRVAHVAVKDGCSVSVSIERTKHAFGDKESCLLI